MLLWATARIGTVGAAPSVRIGGCKHDGRANAHASVRASMGGRAQATVRFPAPACRPVPMRKSERRLTPTAATL